MAGLLQLSVGPHILGDPCPDHFSPLCASHPTYSSGYSGPWTVGHKHLLALRVHPGHIHSQATVKGSKPFVNDANLPHRAYRIAGTIPEASIWMSSFPAQRSCHSQRDNDDSQVVDGRAGTWRPSLGR